MNSPVEVNRSLSVAEIERGVRALARSEPRLQPWIERHGPPPLTRTRNTFASLGRAIIYQQLTGKAAGTIYRRFLELYPRRRFPTPAALVRTPLERLRLVGLSARKASYLLDLAHHFDTGRLSARRLSKADESDIRGRLTAVRGIGHWSVDMYLIFGLVRPDVLPTGDLGVKKGMAKLFQLSALPEPARMRELATPWRPYRSLASWYLWRVAEDQDAH